MDCQILNTSIIKCMIIYEENLHFELGINKNNSNDYEHFNRVTHQCIKHCYQRGHAKETMVKISLKISKSFVKMFKKVK